MHVTAEEIEELFEEAQRLGIRQWNGELPALMAASTGRRERDETPVGQASATCLNCGRPGEMRTGVAMVFHVGAERGRCAGGKPAASAGT
jgi:hypothetical protein